ncbi:hypothetical protein V8E54_009786 [Elaphomyces granulatus]
MVQSSSRKEQPMLKSLQRDDYRCIVTGTIDPAAERAYPDVVFDENWMGPTNASHIIPFALGRYQNAAQVSFYSPYYYAPPKSEFQEQTICHIWTTLFALFPALHDVISADTINEPKNVMTLLEVLNTQFGKLNFALSQLHFLPSPDVHGKRQVKFERYNHCDLPSRILLETHAAIARIFNASGKADQIDKVLRDCDEIRCLASDGSTDIETLLPILVW